MHRLVNKATIDMEPHSTSACKSYILLSCNDISIENPSMVMHEGSPFWRVLFDARGRRVSEMHLDSRKALMEEVVARNDGGESTATNLVHPNAVSLMRERGKSGHTCCCVRLANLRKTNRRGKRKWRKYVLAKLPANLRLAHPQGEWQHKVAKCG